MVYLDDVIALLCARHCSRISCSNNVMFSPCIKYVSSELMELRPAVDVVPTLQCMMVMYGLGILAIDRLKESCQPIMGNGPLGNDLSVPNRKRTYSVHAKAPEHEINAVSRM